MTKRPKQWFHVHKNKLKLEYEIEKKILWAIFVIIPFIHLDKHLNGALGIL
jgi:hypothetical protein